MKKLLAVLTVLSLVTLLFAACGGSDGSGGATPATDGGSTAAQPAADGDNPPVKLVVAHNQTSTDNPYQYGMVKFQEVVEEISGGNITVEVHAGTIGTNEDELIEKLTLGAADMVVASPGFMTKIGVPEVDFLSLPYLFDSFDHWESAVDGEFGDTMAQVIKEKTGNGFKIMGYWSAGVRDYYGKTPVNTPDDLNGLTIRTQSSQVQLDFFLSCGAIPTQVAWNELYQALQQGTVDAAENDYTNFMLMDHHKTENGKYVSETHHDYTTRFLLMNGNRFDQLTQQQQEWVLEAVAQATEEEREVTYRMMNESKEKVIADGGIVNEVDIAPFKEIAVPIQDAFAEENNMVEYLQKVRDAA